MMETMIPPQVRMRLQTLQKEKKKGERPKRKKKKAEERKKGEKKMREKERRDNVTILLPHLCFKVAP